VCKPLCRGETAEPSTNNHNAWKRSHFETLDLAVCHA
jgi:hypothetical protein